MDLVSFGFLGLVVLLGGFVAYLADGLGRKLGKKRLSLFGLRPRHTATILTIGAGLLIPLMTVLSLSVASSDFRQWLTEGRAAIQESKRLAGRVREQRLELTGLTDRLKTANADVVIAQQRLFQADAKLKSLDAKVKTLESAANVAEAKRAKAQSGLESARKSLEGTLAKLDKVSADLEDIRKASTELQRSFALQQEDLKGAYDQNKRITDENLKLEGSNEKLKADISDFEAKLKELNIGIDSARKELTDAQEQASLAKEELTAKTEELSQVRSLLNQASTQFEANLGMSRTRPIMFGMNEELIRLSLPSSLIEAEALDAVRKLQIQASSLADSRGASTNPSLGLSAGLFFRTDGDRTITIDEQEKAIASALAGQNQEVLLVGYSALNAFQGEFVALVIKPYRNPTVFKLGEAIVEGRIDGSQADTTIYSQLTSLLSENLTKAALAKGMIPRQNAEGGFGQVTADKIFELVRQISTVGRTVRVTVVAAENTRAGDSLRVDFRLR